MFLTAKYLKGKSSSSKRAATIIRDLARDSTLNIADRGVMLTCASIIDGIAARTSVEAKNKKAAEQLVVVYDDLDLPLGTLKVSFNRGAGGHRGLDSVIKLLKTREFTRIRIGTSSATPSGKVKKPIGEKAVISFILGKFKPKETETLKKSFKKALEAVEIIVSEKSPLLGREKAMGEVN